MTTITIPRAELAKPVEPITTDMAVKRLCQALSDDLDYAWSWHCNVAMTAYDAGCPHDVANEGAARFMQLLAGVDTRQHFAFEGTQAKTDAASPTPAWHDAPETIALKAERDELLAALQGVTQMSRCGQLDRFVGEPWLNAVFAAIAKAEGAAE